MDKDIERYAYMSPEQLENMGIRTEQRAIDPLKVERRRGGRRMSRPSNAEILAACDAADKHGHAKATLDNLNVYRAHVEAHSPEVYRWLRALVTENEALREERVELLIEILHEHSFQASEPGWYYHSSMRSQEDALDKLVKSGEYELHPEWYDEPGRAWFRPVAKETPDA